jgi:FKBP-type peptidyl-prolyl cis-trans isomerase
MNMTMTGDEGLLGLCTGAKAILVIPPDMGYGAAGAGGAIPGGATVSSNTSYA